MPELGGSRRKLKIAIGVLAALDLAALGVLFSPLVGSAESRQEQMRSLTAELQGKTRTVAPLRGMDKKIELSKVQINQFYRDRFSSNDSDVLAELGKLAQENSVRIVRAKYEKLESEGNGVTPLSIAGSFSGDYVQLMRFVNAVERSRTFFNIDSINLGSEGAGPVKLEVKLHTFLKET
jgi:type IV pilus assembly protein PilO